MPSFQKAITIAVISLIAVGIAFRFPQVKAMVLGNG